MSKRKHKNRPKGPSNEQRQRASKKSEPEVKPSLISRRTALLGLLGLGVGTALGFRSDTESGNKKAAVKKHGLNRQEVGAVPDKPLLTRTPEWMKGIKLPQIKLEPSPVDWDLEKRTEYFIPEVAKQGSGVYEPLKQFYKFFDVNLHHLFSRIDDIKDVASRMKEIKAFEKFVAINYRKGTSSGPNITTCDLNRFLIPHKKWMKFSTSYNANAAFFDVEKIHMAQIQDGRNTESLPVVFLANQQDAIANPTHQETRINGFYLRKCGYIAVDKDGIKKSVDEVIKNLESELRKLGLNMIPIDRRTFYEDAVNMALVHEGVHASLDKISGIDPEGSHAMKRKGTISMGDYEIFEEEYFKSDNLQVHELIALSAGMASSKNTAFGAVWSAAGTSITPNGYDLARYVFALEIVHSPHISEGLHRKFITDLTREGVIKHDNIIRAFKEIPPEGFQDIGERVAKLGLYLVQEEKRR